MKIRNVRYFVEVTYRFIGSQELHTLERVFDLGMGSDDHEENVLFARNVAMEYILNRLNPGKAESMIWLAFSAVDADQRERDLAKLQAWQDGEPIR